MAIFIGNDGADNAVDAALRIHWVVKHIVHERLILDHEAYSDKWIQSEWELKHRTGIDLGEAFVVRAGVRGNHDLVSIGDPPNIAAKLSDFKGEGPTTITEDVWDKLKYDNCFRASDHAALWSQPVVKDIGGRHETIRNSTWWRPYS